MEKWLEETRMKFYRDVLLKKQFEKSKCEKQQVN